MAHAGLRQPPRPGVNGDPPAAEVRIRTLRSPWRAAIGAVLLVAFTAGAIAFGVHFLAVAFPVLLAFAALSTLGKPRRSYTERVIDVCTLAACAYALYLFAFDPHWESSAHVPLTLAGGLAALAAIRNGKKAAEAPQAIDFQAYYLRGVATEIVRSGARRLAKRFRGSCAEPDANR